jgi:hypothetical protein
MIPGASAHVLMFRAPALIIGGTEGVGYRFNVLRARNLCRRCLGRRVPFSSFALLYSFSVVPRATGLVFLFCMAELIFGVTEGFRSLFHVLCARTHFRRCRGRRVPFSCFALPYSFSAVQRASAPVFMFCAPVLVFGGTEGVGSRFQVLLSCTRFRWFRGRRVPFSYFERPNLFSTAPGASGPVFMFCAPGVIFGGTEGVGSHFHVFALLSSFPVVPRASGPVFMVGAPRNVSTVPRASSPIFMFCAPGLVFGVTEGVGPVFMFCAPGLVFSDSEGVVSRFHL